MDFQIEDQGTTIFLLHTLTARAHEFTGYTDSVLIFNMAYKEQIIKSIVDAGLEVSQ